MYYYRNVRVQQQSGMRSGEKDQIERIISKREVSSWLLLLFVLVLALKAPLLLLNNDNNILIVIIIHMQEPLAPCKKQSVSFEHFTPEFITKLMELQGECKIREVMYLRINYPKAIILTFLLSITIIGLFLLKYFYKLRALVFYSVIDASQISLLTHVYVKGQEGEEEICEVNKIIYNENERVVFQFKKLKYEAYEGKTLPVGFPYIERVGEMRQEPFINNGLDQSSVSKRDEFYGKNQHKVEVPGYLQFMFDTMTKPFFLFQYLVSFIYILENVAFFAVLMIFFGFVTTTVNYFLLKKSYNKIKETAEKLFLVKVLRDGQFKEINNVDIVPGDLYEPSGEIPCDSIVLRGQLFVDEVNLTGENVPIAKFSLVTDTAHNDKSHWLFEGSTVETVKAKTLALAVNVGYGSQRGRIIRKILNKTSKQPQFFVKLIYFQLQVMIISFILYLAALPQLLSLQIDPIMVVFRFFDFITYSFPAPFPIFFNLAYSFCLVRLSNESIIGTQADKTVESSRMKTVCFDKTGTLTLNKMEVANVFAFTNNGNDDVTAQLQQQSKENRKNLDGNALISAVFACCNSVQLIGDIVKGDEIDLRMFDHVKGKLFPSSSQGVVREVAGTGGRVEILKINQYESQFQSMSVLVRDLATGKLFIFVKGSPEMIHQHSVRKIAGFQRLIKRLSFAGFRSIGFGYKEVAKQQLSDWLVKPRQQFLEDSSILGVVTFVNQLKADAKSTVSALAQCEINAKIITGDNIFLGVQTALAVGMIPQHARVTVIQGKDYVASTNSVVALHLSRNDAGELEQHSQTITDFRYNDAAGHYYAIDNDFIRQNPNGFLHNNVKVFARTSPENKALIVRRHKQRIKDEQSQLSFFQKLFKDCSYKVGMVGDGANDLIAIKQAHVGIGISTSDAVFSASFAVQQLAQILEIIKESKNTERQIVEMTKYYGLTQFTSIVVTLILSTDASYFTSIQLIYKSFLNTLIITLFFGMTKPAKQMTKYLNNSNLVDLENHLVYWVTMILYSAGLIGSYVYYVNSGSFTPNTHVVIRFPRGWFGETQSSTVNFITSNILYIFLPFAIYRSEPWKLPIWTNKPVTIIIIVNILLLVPLSLFTKYLGFMGLQAIPIKQIFIIWAIMLITSAIVIIVNRIIEKVFFNRQKKQMEGNSIQYQEQLKAEA